MKLEQLRLEAKRSGLPAGSMNDFFLSTNGFSQKRMTCTVSSEPSFLRAQLTVSLWACSLEKSNTSVFGV